MLQNFIKKIGLFFLIILVFPFYLSHSTETAPIKVAFIQDDGFYSMEVNGGYSGYNYDYLMKVAQYTGWTYDFVEIVGNDQKSSQEIAEEMLLAGEIDLIGSMYASPENQEKFLFGEKNYGVARQVLCALGNNNKITANSFFQQENLSAALVKGNQDAIDAFFLIMETKDMDPQVIYVDSEAEALALLKAEEVDTVMAVDVSVNGSILANLTSLSPKPFYFISNKANQDLIDSLDEAIIRIELAEYSITNQLVYEHFGLLHTGPIILTQEEEAALADYPYLTVGLLKGREPYQFYTDQDQSVPSGISVEILEAISKIIDVEFRYVWLDSREEMKEKLASREIDLCSTVPFDSNYELTYFFDVIVTQPYLTNAVTWLHQTEEQDNAIPHYYYLADNIPLFSDEVLVEVWDLEESLQLLSQKGNISLFADPYMAQYQLQKLGLSNVEMKSVSSIQSKICFGVGKHLDSTVVGLLNHAILHLDPFEVDEIIYNNVNVKQNITLQAFIQAHSLAIIFWISLLFLLIVGFLVYHARKLRSISQQDSMTKLCNSGHFHQYTAEKVKKLSQGGLVLLDIDYFKQVNDTHGHQKGDEVICQVAASLKKYFRSQVVVARLGGDEFAVLLESPWEKEALERIFQSILIDLQQNPSQVPVTLSIGGYLFSSTKIYNDLYNLADKNLYEVKERGRNGYLFQEENEAF